MQSKKVEDRDHGRARNSVSSGRISFSTDRLTGSGTEGSSGLEGAECAERRPNVDIGADEVHDDPRGANGAGRAMTHPDGHTVKPAELPSLRIQDHHRHFTRPATLDVDGRQAVADGADDSAICREPQ